MKKIISLFLFYFNLSTAFAQEPILPEVPSKIEFAGVIVNFDNDVQKSIQKEIRTLLIPENRYLMDKLERIQVYLPIIEKILENESVPDDFKYLAISESSLLSDAISSSNAVGFWQLKEETAKELGLEINRQIDERRNIFSSTKAAANYLKKSNSIYKNWISTLFSYYLGVEGISRTIPSAWTNALNINFDKQTDKYLIKVMANRIAFEYKINRMKDSGAEILEYDKGDVSDLEQISKALDLNISDLKKYNTWILGEKIPSNKKYTIAIPVNQENIEVVQAKINKQKPNKNRSPKIEKTIDLADNTYPMLTLLSSNLEAGEVFYEINGKKGIQAQAEDDLESLCRKGKIKTKDFLAHNDMNENDPIEANKVYYLEKKNKKGVIAEHIALEGESFWSISQMYGIKLSNLLSLNRLNTPQNIASLSVIYLQKKRPKNEPLENAPSSPTITEKEEKVFVKDSRKSDETPTKNEQELDNPLEITTNNNEKDDDIIVIEDDEQNTNKVIEKPSTESTAEPINNSNISKNPTKEKPIVTIKKNDSFPKNTNETKVVNQNNRQLTHVVEEGQTLYSLSRLYQVPVKEIAAWNNFGMDTHLLVGQEVIIKKTNQQKSSSNAMEYHEVQQSETLYSISKKYGVTVKQIQLWNDLPDNNVKIGQKIIIRK